MLGARKGRGDETMAKTALNTLQDQIEAVRREAFAAGYAAAMQAVRELAAKTAPGAETTGTAPQRGRRRAAGRRRAVSVTASAPAAADRPAGRRQRQPRAASAPPARGR